jgi:hypothetical protein
MWQARGLPIANPLPPVQGSELQVRQAIRRSWSIWSRCLLMEPGERGSGIVFENKIVGGSIPKEYIPAIEKGSRKRGKRCFGWISGCGLEDYAI